MRRRTFREFLGWVEKQEHMPQEDGLQAYQSENATADVQWLNAQLHSVLCMNVVQKALPLIKKLKNNEVNGAQGWREIKNEAARKTAQRTQGLAEKIFHPNRVTIVSELVVGIEVWERNCGIMKRLLMLLPRKA